MTTGRREGQGSSCVRSGAHSLFWNGSGRNGNVGGERSRARATITDWAMNAEPPVYPQQHRTRTDRACLTRRKPRTVLRVLRVRHSNNDSNGLGNSWLGDSSQIHLASRSVNRSVDMQNVFIFSLKLLLLVLLIVICPSNTLLCRPLNALHIKRPW